MRDTIYEFNTTKDLVEQLLLKEERCRNDDKWLCYRVISHFTKVFIPFDDFDKFPAFETITRCRRMLQNTEHKYLASDKVFNDRQDRENEVKFWVRSQK